MMAETYCTAFMEGLPPEKQAEGLGVQAAVILGECFRCKDYARCSTDETFKFPADAACMVRRDMVLKEWDWRARRMADEYISREAALADFESCNTEGTT